jgi:Laminin B (Domain IV)/CHU_C Type IX secretion signal domain
MKHFLLLKALIFLFCMPLSAQISRFDIDDEKWVANIDAIGHIVHWDDAEGNPPPSIYADDSNTGQPWYFVAPDCYLGDRSYAYGDTFKYDIMTFDIGQTAYTNDVIIVGGNGLTLVHNNSGIPKVGVWTTYKTRLIESEWHLNSGAGPNPTQSQFVLTLANIISLQIRGEYMTGFDRAWLDNVWMGEIPDTTISVNICKGETIQVGDYTHTVAGTYLDEVEDENGCDSILVTLHLKVNKPYTESQKWHICQGEQVNLPDGTTTGASGIYQYKFTAANGCDSTVTVEVKSQPVYDKKFAINLCQGEQYALPNGSITDQPGSYYFGYQTIYGCDSAVTFQIAKHDTSWSSYKARICGGEFYTLPDGSFRQKTGIYESRLQSLWGCDSTIVVDLTVIDSSLDRVSQDRCVANPYKLPDGTLTDSSGVYIFQYPNYAGCDSTWVYELRFHPEADTTIRILLPEDKWHTLPDGRSIVNEDIDEVYGLETNWGCDSTVHYLVEYVYYRVYPPNAIRPDSEQGNSLFTLFTNRQAKEIKTLHIYDRWGTELYSRNHFAPNDPELGWDGNYRGKPCESGVYTWWGEVEFIDGFVVFLKGDLTIVR